MSALYLALTTYHDCFASLRPFREKIRHLPESHALTVRRLFAASRLTIVLRSEQTNRRTYERTYELAALAAVASVLYHNPLISVQLLVRDLASFHAQHSTIR